MNDLDRFEEWFARSHPWDWYAAEIGKPIPRSVRLHIWAMCKAAWDHRDLPQRDEDKAGDRHVD